MRVLLFSVTVLPTNPFVLEDDPTYILDGGDNHLRERKLRIQTNKTLLNVDLVSIPTHDGGVDKRLSRFKTWIKLFAFHFLPIFFGEHLNISTLSSAQDNY